MAKIVNVVSRIGTQINRYESMNEEEDRGMRGIKKTQKKKKDGIVPVTRKIVYKQLIQCGLRLERMVAILSQKNQIFPIESINTVRIGK